jgi:hypothetical protein
MPTVTASEFVGTNPTEARITSGLPVIRPQWGQVGKQARTYMPLDQHTSNCFAILRLIDRERQILRVADSVGSACHDERVCSLGGAGIVDAATSPATAAAGPNKSAQQDNHHGSKGPLCTVPRTS